MTHKLYFLSALTMTALLASACTEHDNEARTIKCNGGTFDGVIKDSIFEPVKDNDNVTHKEEKCIEQDESCVVVYGTIDHYACSKYSSNFLIECNKEKIDARTDNNHCGSCGNKCSENKDCVEGKCVEKNTTSICDPNDVNCKDKPDEHVTDNVCTAGARRCGSDGKTPELCEENAWKPQSACENECIGNGECRICQEGAKSCDAEGKRPRVCHNNTWEDQAVCTGNMVCVDGDCGCPEGWQTCEGAEGCFDLANDANNCGACGNAVYNDYYACRDGKMCVANGGGYFPHQPGGECCDPNAKQYIYLGGRPDCQNAETDIFSNKEEKQFYLYSDEDSYPYCLTESDIQHYYPSEKDTCFALKAETSHLTNAEECGVLGNYKACDLKNSNHESVQACVLGRCCLIGNLFYGAGGGGVKIEGIDKKNIKGSDCCSGYAYYYSAPNGGSTTSCTDTPNYCKDVCGTDDCSRSTEVGPVTCRML